MTATHPGVTRERLLEMMTAYKATYVLRAAVELGVFDGLAAGPATAPELAARLGTDPRATAVLLGALTAEGLLVDDGPRSALAPGTERLLVRESPEYFGGNTVVAASDWEWRLMAGLADVVRGGGPPAAPEAEQPDFGFWVDFATHLTGLTRAGSGWVAGLLEPWAAGRERLDVLDVGCGHGVFGLAVAGLRPDGRVGLQDWPAVLDVAAQHAGRAGMTARTTPLPGDAFTADLAGPYDVVLFANVLLQFSAGRATALLRRARAVLRPGGRVVLAGFTTGDDDPAQERHAHLLALLMLAGTAGGELHSTARQREMLVAAGLEHVATHTHPALPIRVVEGARGQEES